MSDLKRIHAVISGRVQGVGFRYYTEKRALVWTERAGQKLRQWKGGGHCRGERGETENSYRSPAAGPALSHVTGIDVQWSQAHGNFDDFSVNIKARGIFMQIRTTHIQVSTRGNTDIIDLTPRCTKNFVKPDCRRVR